MTYSHHMIVNTCSDVRPALEASGDEGLCTNIRPMALRPYTQPGEYLPFNLDDAMLISDTHFLHRRLAEEYEPSRSALPQDHNRFMVEAWRQAVAPEQVIVHLGDLALGKSDGFAAIAPRLPGRKFLMRGNHDRRSRSWYREHGFELIPPFWLDYRGWKVRFQHNPDYEHKIVCYPRHILVHGHVHSKTLGDRRQINVSVEVTGFRPVPVCKLLDERIAELATTASAGRRRRSSDPR